MRLRATILAGLGYVSALGAMWLGLGFAASSALGPDAGLSQLVYLLPLIGLAVFQGVLSIARFQLPVLAIWVAGPVLLYGSTAGMVLLADAGLVARSVGLTGLLMVWLGLAIVVAHRATPPLPRGED